MKTIFLLTFLVFSPLSLVFAALPQTSSITTKISLKNLTSSIVLAEEIQKELKNEPEQPFDAPATQALEAEVGTVKIAELRALNQICNSACRASQSLLSERQTNGEH